MLYPASHGISSFWSCGGYLDHPFKNRHCEKRLIKEQRGAAVEQAREGLMDDKCCVGAQKSASDLVCKVLVSERASEKGGTEGVGSAIEG
jgi:hypothetical protein